MKSIINANMNKNLNMNQYKSFFSDKTTTETNAYKEIHNSIEALKGSDYANKMDDFYYKAYDIGSPEYNISQMEQNFDHFSDMMQGKNGNVFSMDLETLAGTSDNFAITELSIVKQDLKTGKYSNVQNTLFGINKTQVAAYEDLISRAQFNYNTLSGEERSTLERLSRYGSKNTVVKMIDNKPSIVNLGQGNPMDLASAKRGIQTLYKYEKYSFGSQFAKQELTMASNNMNSIRGASNMLFTHNGTKFDLPMLNKALDLHNVSKLNNNINHIDFLNSLRTAYNGNMLDFHLDARNINTVQGPLRGELDSLSKIAESLGIKVESHVAAEDARALLRALTSKVSPNSFVYNEVADKIKAYSTISGQSVISNNDMMGKVLFTKQAVKTTGLDFITSPVGVKSYGDWMLQRNNFYNIQGFGKITSDVIKSNPDLFKNLNTVGANTIDGMYFMTLKNASTEVSKNETVTLIRKTKEEFQSLFQKNLDIYKFTNDITDIKTGKLLDNQTLLKNKIVTQSIIDANTKLSITDIARRKFEGMFQTSGKGFNYAESLYSTYNNINANGVLNKLDVEKMIINNPKSEMLKGLMFKGELIPERVSDFLNMYGVIGDTSETMTTAINQIKLQTSDLVGSSGDVKRTVALGNVYRDIQQNMINLGIPEDIAKNKVLTSAYPMDIDVISMNIGEKDFTVRTRSVAEARSNILNNIDNIIGVEKNKKVRDTKRLYHLKELAKNVYKDNPEKYNRMFDNLNSAHYITGEIAADLHTQYLEGNIERFLRNPIISTDISKYDIHGLTYDQIVKSNLNLGDIVDKSVASVTNGVELNSNTIGMKDGMFTITNDDIYNKLTKNYGYLDDDINSLLRGLYGTKKGNVPYGLANAYDLSAEIFEKDNKLNIAITNKKNATKMFEDISKGIFPDKAIISELPKVEMMPTIDGSDGLRMLTFGNVQKEVTSSLNTYTKDVSNHYFNNIAIVNKTNVSDSLSGITKLHYQIPGLIESGEFERGSKLLKNAISSPIYDSTGFSGYTTAKEGSTFAKKLLPNVADIISSSNVDLKGLVNFVPALYESDESIRESLNKLKSGYKPIDASFMKQWEKEILDGNLKSFNNLGIEFQEWFTINMFQGDKILEKVKDLKSLDGDLFKKEISMLDDILEKGSFLNKPGKVSEAIAALENPHEYITMGFMNEMSRPTARQSLSFHAINPEEISSAINKFTQYDVSLGQSMVTEKMANNYLSKYKYEVGVTGNILNASTEDIHNMIKQSQTSLDMLKQSYGEEQVDRMINKLKMIGDTNQQHSIISPFLTNEVWKEPELVNLKLHGGEFSFAEGIDIGTNVKANDVIGYIKNKDGINKKVINTVQDSMISQVFDNKIVLKPLEAQVEEMKILLGNVEKSAASTLTRSAKEYELAQDVWNTVFGKDISVVSRFEIGKHESATIAYSTIPELGERAITSGDDAMKLFENSMANGLPSWKMRYDENLVKYVISGNPLDKGDHIKNIHKMFDILEQNDTNGVFSDIIKKFKTGDTNVYRTIISKGQMSERFSSMSGNEDLFGKGFKVGERELQIAGIRPGENILDFYTKNNNGEYVKKFQPVIDLWQKEIQTESITKNGENILTNYGKAKSDLKNITSVMDILQNKDVSAKINQLDFADINPIMRGVDSATLTDALNKTPFAEGTNVYKVNLPNNLKIKNPLTGNIESNIVIPYLHSYNIDGNIILHESHKKTTDLIRSLSDIAEGKLPNKVSNINELQTHLNNTYSEAISSYAAEFSNDKNNLFRKHITSGRLPNSGRGLVGAVVSPSMFNLETGEVLNDVLDKDIINMSKGKPILKDIAYTSEEMMKSMGVDFTTIGKQVLFDKDINKEVGNVNNFLKEIKDLSTLNIKNMLDKDFEIIGKSYTKSFGIMGAGLRYPSFLQTSMATMNFRLSDPMKGYKFNIMPWTAAGFNADVDADTLSTWLNLDKEGGIKSSKDVSQRALIDTFESQSKNNLGLYNQAMEDYNKLSTITHTREGYETFLKEKIAPKLGMQSLDDMDKVSNNLRNDIRLMTATKANVDKAAIGYISNVNVNLRDVALKHFGKTGDIDTFKNILDFTDITEQKIIDVKHVKSFDDAIVQANRYMSTINSIASGKPKMVNSAISDMKEILFKSGTLDRTAGEDVAKAERFGQSLSNISSMMNEQWKNVLRTKNINQKNFQELALNLSGENLIGGTDFTDRTINAIKSLRDIEEIKIKDTLINTEDLILNKINPGETSVPIGSYTYNKTGVGNITNKPFIDLQELITDINQNKNEVKQFRIYGDSLKDIQTQIEKDFTISDNIRDPGTLVRNINENIRETGKNLAMGSTDEIIERIKSTQLYDTKGVYEELSNRMQRMNNEVKDTHAKMVAGQIEGLSGEELIQFGKQRINSELVKTNVVEPFKIIQEGESQKLQQLQSMYSEILGRGEETKIGWNKTSQDIFKSNVPKQIIQNNLSLMNTSEVTYGQYTGLKFSDLSIEQLNEVRNIDTSIGKNLSEVNNINSLKTRVNDYFTLIDKNNTNIKTTGYTRPTANISEILKDVKLNTVDETVNNIRGLTTNIARGTIEMETENIIRSSERLLGERTNTKSLVLAGLALGLAGTILGYTSAKPGPLQVQNKNKGSGSSPSVDGSYDEPEVAYNPKPVSEKKIYSQDNKGIKINVSASNPTNASNSQIAEQIHGSIQGSLPNKMNTNFISNDNTTKIDNNWLEKQFKNLIGG